MSLLIPAAKNYSSPLIAVPAFYNRPPVEGARMVSCEIDWGSANMGGPNNCVAINLQNNATLNFSQICALSVDNSQSGSDVTFIFPDAGQTYTIPAYSPADVLPVFTAQTQFYVSCPNALATDVTRFAIHNTVPPPSAIPVTQEQNFAVNNNVPITNGTTDTQLIAAGVNGTIENLGITGQLSSGNSLVVVSLVDGSGAVVWGGQMAGTAGVNTNAILAALNTIAVRFQNGLKLHMVSTSTVVNAAISANVYYRTP